MGLSDKKQKYNYNINNDNLIGTDENNKEEIKDIKLIDKMNIIIEYIINDINECNEKQLKDIIILIDFNYSNKLTIDSYIDVTKTILKNYLTNNDRLGVFLLINENRIICPMLRKCEIDILNFSKDLDNYSDKIFTREKLDFSIGNEIKLEGGEYNSRNSQENTFSSDGFGENKVFITNYEMHIEDTIKSLNYCINYLKMKEINRNEKFFIYFNTNIKKLMDYLMYLRDYESPENNIIDLQINNSINFLLVGKINSEKMRQMFIKKYYHNILGQKVKKFLLII